GACSLRRKSFILPINTPFSGHQHRACFNACFSPVLKARARSPRGLPLTEPESSIEPSSQSPTYRA
ncbi:MAG: hypothetical protein ACPLOU_06310, partial [bacterium]